MIHRYHLANTAFDRHNSVQILGLNRDARLRYVYRLHAEAWCMAVAVAAEAAADDRPQVV